LRTHAEAKVDVVSKLKVPLYST